MGPVENTIDVKIDRVSDDLYLITLPPPTSGFSGFICVWLYKGDITFLVDVGPSNTIPGLLKALKKLAVGHLDYILLTHIHLDHAGGIGEIAEIFPTVPIVCHKTGIAHLVDPSRLWQGSVRTLGDIAVSYGPIKSVGRDRFIEADRFHSDSVIPVITPGHASHHVSFYTNDYLFAGETGGVCLPGSNKTKYLRPATPPKFFLETCLKSIEALISIKPKKICYGHWGIRANAVEMLNLHKEQLLLWNRIIADEVDGLDNKAVIEICLDRLLREDYLLGGFFDMESAVKQREKDFLTNSIKGFVGFHNRIK